MLFTHADLWPKLTCSLLGSIMHDTCSVSLRFKGVCITIVLDVEKYLNSSILQILSLTIFHHSASPRSQYFAIPSSTPTFAEKNFLAPSQNYRSHTTTEFSLPSCLPSGIQPCRPQRNRKYFSITVLAMPSSLFFITEASERRSFQLYLIRERYVPPTSCASIGWPLLFPH